MLIEIIYFDFTLKSVVCSTNNLYSKGWLTASSESLNSYSSVSENLRIDFDGEYSGAFYSNIDYANSQIQEVDERIWWNLDDIGATSYVNAEILSQRGIKVRVPSDAQFVRVIKNIYRSTKGYAELARLLENIDWDNKNGRSKATIKRYKGAVWDKINTERFKTFAGKEWFEQLKETFS